MLEVGVRREPAGRVGGEGEPARCSFDEYDGALGWRDQVDQATSRLLPEVAAASGCLNARAIRLRCALLRRCSSTRVRRSVPATCAGDRSARLRRRPAGCDADTCDRRRRRGRVVRRLLHSSAAARKGESARHDGNENERPVHACIYTSRTGAPSRREARSNRHFRFVSHSLSREKRRRAVIGSFHP